MTATRRGVGIGRANASARRDGGNRLDDAAAVLRKAISLDPYLPHPQASLTYLLGFARRLEESERLHAATFATNPNYFYSHGVMSLVYFINERFAEALREGKRPKVSAWTPTR